MIIIIFNYLILTCFRCAVLTLAGNARRLHAGGGIGKARTRAKDVVTCSVSDETAPPLA